MLETHTDRNGRKILIAQMDDDHLNNMILLVIRRAQEVVNSAQGSDEISDFDRALYNIPSTSPEDAAYMVRQALQQLYPYLAEAYLRGLEGPRLALADFLGRDSQVLAKTPLALNAGRELHLEEDYF